MVTWELGGPLRLSLRSHMASLPLPSTGQSSQRPAYDTQSGEIRPTSPWEEGQRVWGHVKAAAAPLQFPPSLAISDDLQQPTSYKPGGFVRARGRADLQTQPLLPVLAVIFGIFVQSPYLPFLGSSSLAGGASSRVCPGNKHNRNYACGHERTFVL